MKKEDYRTIEYDIDPNYKTESKKGLFHKLLTKKDDYGGEYVMVIIETEDGMLKEVHKETIRFTD